MTTGTAGTAGRPHAVAPAHPSLPPLPPALPPLGGRPARPRGVLVTAAGPAMRPVLHDLALPTFRRYAQAWGYAVHAEDLPVDGAGADTGAQQAKWAKTRLLREALRAYPVVVWVDADVLILRDDEDVAAHVHPHCFQGLALESVPAERRVNPNTGVWVLRGRPESLAFLDQVERLGPQVGPWADQGAVLAALGWDRGDDRYHWARPGQGSRFLEGTSWLPTGWNQPWLGERGSDESFNSTPSSYADRPSVPRPHALHFMGLRPAARYRHMAAALAATAGALQPA